MKMFLISDNRDTLIGMRLAGVEGIQAEGISGFLEAWKEVLENKEIGILIITEKLSNEHKELIKAVKIREGLPLIISIPGCHGTKKDKDFISKYIKEAIGVKI
ncbi:MAG: V-type ATP synthase subunit F [Defluviitaleaceae bacterium]|nr:V-type ATP synthase subunit F [Defluviitaleaceae bacterium]